MKRTNWFDKDAVLLDLDPLLRILYPGFERCILLAHEFFVEQGRPMDKGLAAHLVRYFMKDFLGEQVELLDDFEQQHMPNSGLAFRYRGYDIRAWKSDGESLPSPGFSHTKSDFLHQIQHQHQITMDELFGVLPLREAASNLAVLWVVDDSFTLQRLIVACPRTDLTGHLPITAEWAEPILDPIYTLEVAATSDAVVASRDLPFERMDSEDSEANVDHDLRREG